MSKYSLPHFNELDINSLDNYYSVEIDFKKHRIELDLNFIEKSIDEQKMESVKIFIDNLAMLHSVALEELKNDFKSGGVVKDYIEHHLEELAEKVAISIVDKSSKTTAKEQQLLSKFYLKRIGFYPENDEQFAVFDFTTDHESTDYIIAVNFTEDGEIVYLSMES